MPRSIALATALATLGACSLAPEPADHGGAGGKADGIATTITFSDDFSDSADGPLVAGLSVRIVYDLDRLTECRGSTAGTEAWGVTGFAQFDGGSPTSFGLSRLVGGRVLPVEAELAIPALATRVAMWFTISDRFGCVAFDSNLSANYEFDLERRGGTAVLAFDADFSESQSSALHAGDTVIVHYEPERLTTCAASTGGHAAWSITGNWQVDGGGVHQLMVTRASGSELVAADPTFTVPRGADLALWFEATSVFGCHQVDSDLGANYHASID